MKLIITETAWGINRVTGAYKQRITEKREFRCKVGLLDRFLNSNRRFSIDEINSDTVKLSVQCVTSDYNKSWVIKAGEEIRYRPRSFDGGYFYDIELKKEGRK